MKLPLVLFAAALQAQTLIDSGSANDQYYSPDQTASYRYQTAALAQQPGVYRDLRAAYPGKTIHYDVPRENGTYNVKVDLMEPRPAGTDPATTVAVGLRIFTVTANGVASQPIDIFAAAGSLKPYPYALAPIQVTDGFLHMDFVSSAGSRLVPVVSAIETQLQPLPPVPGPPGPQGPPGSPGPQGTPGYVSIAIPNPNNIVCVAPLSCPVDPANPNTLTIKLIPPTTPPAQ